MVEHYTNAGVLDCVVEGSTPTAIYAEIVKLRLVSQLDHTAYLWREQSTAQRSLKTGEPYVQDRAPGAPTEDSGASGILRVSVRGNSQPPPSPRGNPAPANQTRVWPRNRNPIEDSDPVLFSYAETAAEIWAQSPVGTEVPKALADDNAPTGQIGSSRTLPLRVSIGFVPCQKIPTHRLQVLPISPRVLISLRLPAAHTEIDHPRRLDRRQF